MPDDARMSTDGWSAVERRFARTGSEPAPRRTWRGVIDALGALGRSVDELAPAADDPDIQARLAAVAPLLDDIATRLAVAIGDTDSAHLGDVRSPLLALDGKTQALHDQVGHLADDVENLAGRAGALRRALDTAEGAPARIGEIEATAAGAADDVVALAARATVTLERVEMTLRELQSAEHYVTKIVAELESATAARERAEMHARDAQGFADSLRADRESARGALADIERLRAELRARANQPVGAAHVAPDPRQDPDVQVRHVIAELRPLIEAAVRRPATPEQIDRLRGVMLELADADLPSRISELRQEAYLLLRDAGVVDLAAAA